MDFQIVGISRKKMKAFSAYTYLLKTLNPSVVSTYSYINPVIAVLLGWCLAGEIVTVHTFIGAAVVLASIWLITRAPKPSTRSQLVPASSGNMRVAR